MGPTGARAILQLHPTRRCNLRCLHCYSESGPLVGAETPLAVLCEVLADAAALGYDVVGISGGEPMLYKPLADLLRAARRHGLRTTVTSNGMLLTERRLAELAGLVDVLAISLDGSAATHDRMRGDPRAFRTLDKRMDAVRASGIPFGFITTLTMHNVDEVEFVVRYAKTHGASLVQLHPLELVGHAVRSLPASVPDARESAFAILEGARLSQLYAIPVQVDVVSPSDLRTAPEQFLARHPGPECRPADWLTPLVVETDGTVVPMTYGFPREFALGNVATAALADLVAAWDPDPFLSVCAGVARDLLDSDRTVINWYDEVYAAARASVAAPRLRSIGGT